jgi:hypothetical protein
MKLRMFVGGVVALAVATACASSALAGSVVVSGASDVWLAGQTTGASVSGYFGSDSIPANAPVRINLTGPVLTFSATGSTSVDGGCFAGANGGCYSDQSGFSPSPWGGLYNGPADALIGIFLDASTPTSGVSGGYQGPLSFVSGPDYQNPSNVGPGAYAPALDQIFLIGDGSGETFTAPAGSTRLYLAVADSIGGSTGNLGALSVDFTGGVAVVPEPATWALMLIGFGGLGAAMRHNRRKQALAVA